MWQYTILYYTILYYTILVVLPGTVVVINSTKLCHDDLYYTTVAPIPYRPFICFNIYILYAGAGEEGK